MRAYAIALAVAVFLVAFDILSAPALFLRAGDDMIVLVRQIRDEVPVTIHFIHSVQKTPVEEFLTAHADGHFHLAGTRYQSHGVGLPFLPEEGTFRQEGEYFILDMDRDYSELSLRTGVGTELTIEAGGARIPVYEMYPVGTRIDLVVAPLYTYFL
ncbi:hypothetical protein HMPREF9081_0220 [Centipeda periodontii DSM 2778]|uniref:DUF1850 domain-containing protein n=1 Tax=Centipeda periodontii DSM 2778 TaxID=888060 RepID=F5RIP1_9FIRM|nr:DUF1850 domain-containing protein [Centipeda periodontii]EGK62473.1 hypothetical protein HMPREF9081_0220 [Centipeda periodontii DSM 2778]